MSKNVFAETDSFRRLLIGAAGGYALQGHREAAEAVMHVVDALDELTTGGEGQKPGHEGFRLLDGPAPDFHRMTVEEFEALPPHIWMDVKKTLPPLEHQVLTVDAYGNYHTNTEYIDNPEIPFCITYNNGRFWPPIAWSKFDRLKWSGD